MYSLIAALNFASVSYTSLGVRVLFWVAANVLSRICSIFFTALFVILLVVFLSKDGFLSADGVTYCYGLFPRSILDGGNTFTS